MYKLPVWRTIGEAYRFIWAARRDWLDYALGPIVVVSLVPALVSFIAFGTPSLTPPQPAPGQDPAGLFGPGIFAGIFLIWVVMIAVYVAFAVAWHRRFLLGPEATSPRELITWRRRHWRFLGKGIVLALLAALASAIVAFMIAFPMGAILGTMGNGGPGPQIAAVAVTWLFVLVIMGLLFVGPALAFPAAAVEDTGFGIGAGWTLSRGNRWRMLGVYVFGAIVLVFLLNVVFLLLIAGLRYLLQSGAGIDAEPSLAVEFVSALLSSAVYFLGIAIGVSLLSIMYRRLRDNVVLETEG